DEYVFVVFCGTQKPGYRSRMRDVLFESVDLEEPLVKFGHRGSINRRVNEALDELWVAAPKSTYGIGLGPMLATIGRDHPQATFWFTGHGFGGALATLAALQHMKVAGLYTFGSPMVGDRLFQRAFEIPAWRFVNNTDVLARLPIVGRYRPLKLLVLGKKHPVGELKFIDANGRIGPVEVLPDGSGVDPFTYVRAKLGGAREAVADHAPLRYSVRTWNDYVGIAPIQAVQRPRLFSKWFGATLKWSAVA